MITVRVPATTANLGPGFDCFGMALTLYGYFTFEELPTGLQFENVPEEFCNADNLAVQAYFSALTAMKLQKTGLYLRIESDIPVSRGLGSSASLIAAGIYAANAAHGCPLSDQEMLTLAAKLEGHPDNVAPALFGGLTVSIMEDGRVLTVPCPVSEKIRVCALVPDFELSTHRARAVLPQNVAFGDAVFNVSHAAATLRALETGDCKLLAAALKDRLHQPYRQSLIAEYDDVHTLADACGAAAVCISGAGPTILCLHENADFGSRMEKAVLSLQHGWRVLPLQVDHEGASVMKEAEAWTANT
jgi:homoserine kinase